MPSFEAKCKLVNLHQLPPTWLVDADVHFSGFGDVKSQQVVAAWSKGRQVPLHSSGEPVGAVLTHIHLTEVAATQTKEELTSHM